MKTLLCTLVTFLAVSSMAAPQKGVMTDSRDGKKYKTVQIGDQTWMAENLNYKSGDSFCYDEKPGNCKKYGQLYSWPAAKNACPAGWHLPSKAEFETLIKAAGGTLDGDAWKGVSKKLKSSSKWKKVKGKNGNGSDAYGFSALPAGSYDYNGGECYDEGEHAFFWSSTENIEAGTNFPYGVKLRYDDDDARLESTGEDSGLSVRCLKD